MKKYLSPIIMLIIFETVAITLWLTKDNLFYLFLSLIRPITVETMLAASNIIPPVERTKML